MKTQYSVWLQIKEGLDVESDVNQESPERCLLATFETKEEAAIFSMELSRKVSPQASGEEDAAISMKAQDQFSPG